MIEEIEKWGKWENIKLKMPGKRKIKKDFRKKDE